jgi:hypothetical protein
MANFLKFESGSVFQKYRQLKGGSVLFKPSIALLGWYDEG